MDVTRLLPNVSAEPAYMQTGTEHKNAADKIPQPDFAEPQCTVEISEEGRRRWENISWLEETDLPGESGIVNEESAPQAASAISEKDEEPELSVEERLANVLKFIEDLRHTYKSKPSKETDDERVESMEQLRQLMEDQEDGYRDLEEKAKEIAVKKAKKKNELEKGNRDLVIMLESFRSKEAADDEDRAKTGKNRAQKSRSESSEPMGEFQTRVKDRAFGKELRMDDTIRAIRERAENNFAHVRDMENDLIRNMDITLKEMEASDGSEDERLSVANKYLAESVPIMGTMVIEHDLGLERLKTLRQIRLERRGNQNMELAASSSDAIGDMRTENAVDEAFRDNTDRLQSEKIEELKERIRELQGRKNGQKTEEETEEEETFKMAEQ